MKEAMPALDMLCDIEINDNKPESNIKQARLHLSKSPYLIWMQEPIKDGKTRTAVPTNLIVGWRYNKNASNDEVIKTFTQ